MLVCPSATETARTETARVALPESNRYGGTPPYGAPSTGNGLEWQHRLRPPAARIGSARLVRATERRTLKTEQRMHYSECGRSPSWLPAFTGRFGRDRSVCISSGAASAVPFRFNQGESPWNRLFDPRQRTGPRHSSGLQRVKDLDGEFDPGSGRTLAACLTHASRARSNRWQHRGRPSGERVSNT